MAKPMSLLNPGQVVPGYKKASGIDQGLPQRGRSNSMPPRSKRKPTVAGILMRPTSSQKSIEGSMPLSTDQAQPSSSQLTSSQLASQTLSKTPRKRTLSSKAKEILDNSPSSNPPKKRMRRALSTPPTNTGGKKLATSLKNACHARTASGNLLTPSSSTDSMLPTRTSTRLANKNHPYIKFRNPRISDNTEEVNVPPSSARSRQSKGAILDVNRISLTPTPHPHRNGKRGHELVETVEELDRSSIMAQWATVRLSQTASASQPVAPLFNIPYPSHQYSSNIIPPPLTTENGMQYSSPVSSLPSLTFPDEYRTPTPTQNLQNFDPEPSVDPILLGSSIPPPPEINPFVDRWVQTRSMEIITPHHTSTGVQTVSPPACRPESPPHPLPTNCNANEFSLPIVESSSSPVPDVAVDDLFDFHMLDMPDVLSLPWVPLESHDTKVYIPSSVHQLITTMRHDLGMESRARHRAEELHAEELHRRIQLEVVLDGLHSEFARLAPPESASADVPSSAHPSGMTVSTPSATNPEAGQLQMPVQQHNYPPAIATAVWGPATNIVGRTTLESTPQPKENDGVSEESVTSSILDPVGAEQLLTAMFRGDMSQFLISTPAE